MSEQMKLHGTAEICDGYAKDIQVLEPVFRSYGGKMRCSGEIITVSLNEDNTSLKSLLQTPGKGRIAVVSVTGEYCAVVGDTLCGFAIDNGWAGIILSGYVRDTNMLKSMPLAVWALGTYPLKSSKIAEGKIGDDLELAGVKFHTGDYLYADEDGIIISEKPFADFNFVK